MRQAGCVSKYTKSTLGGVREWREKCVGGMRCGEGRGVERGATNGWGVLGGGDGVGGVCWGVDRRGPGQLQNPRIDSYKSRFPELPRPPRDPHCGH